MKKVIARWVVLAAASASSLTADATAADVVSLTPSSDWKLVRDEDKCRLVRTFATGEDHTILVLDQSGPDARFNVTAIGRPVRNPIATDIGVAFGPAGEVRARNFVFGQRGKVAVPYVLLHGVSLPAVDSTGTPADPTNLTLSKALQAPVTFETGPLAKPVERLRGCAKELSLILGLNRLGQAGFSRPPQPIGNPGDWGIGAYPPAALRRDREGVVPFRLTVDRQGQATSCYITGVEETNIFEDRVCLILLKRAKFSPALDPDGKPVPAYWSSSVRFEIRG